MSRTTDGQAGRDGAAGRPDAEHHAAAAGWVVHLRSGGTTPWTEWLRDVGRPAVAPGTTELPGAPQLELLRRLNVLGFQPARVDQVLNRPAPGRGAVDLALPWPPAEPAADRDLVRVACGVLADLTASLPPPARTRAGRLDGLRGAFRAVGGRSRARPPTVAFGGPPYTVASLRAPAAGRRRHRRPDLALVVVAPVEQALHEVWSRRAEHGPVGTWAHFVEASAERDRLPRAIDPGAAARRWVDRLGADRVHVVPLADAPQLLEQLGVPRHEQSTGPLGATHVELLRRVNKVLTFVVPREELALRRGRLVEQLRADADPWDPALGAGRLAVPPDACTWLTDATRRATAEVEATGCQVHGDVAAALAPASAPAPAPAPAPGAEGGEVRVRRDLVVAAAVRMIHRVGRVVDEAGAGRRG